MENRICCRWIAGIRMACGVVVLLSGAGYSDTKPPGSAHSSQASVAVQVSLAIHPVQSLQRSGLVLLHFLVSAISQGCPWLFATTNWRDGVGAVSHSRRGK